MPRLYLFQGLAIYFWTAENGEPVHVHVAERRPIPDGTKLWITKSGKTLVCHNKSRISDNRIRQLCRFIEANSAEIVRRWEKEFGEIRYYC